MSMGKGPSINPADMQQEEIEDIKATFTQFDRDGDGTISTDELLTVLNATGLDPTRDDIEELVNLFDMDESGNLDFSEFLNLMVMVRKDVQSTEDIMDCFSLLDADGNGVISRAELQEILCNFGDKLTEEECNAVFKAVDNNDDGVLSFDEITAYMRGAK